MDEGARDRVERVLKERFKPLHLEVHDDSEIHAGHIAAKTTGGGHFRVTIVSNFFEGKGSLERHRAIYDALRNELQEAIHALVLKTFSPKEFLVGR